jgi:hypothetical protein
VIAWSLVLTIAPMILNQLLGDNRHDCERTTQTR